MTDLWKTRWTWADGLLLLIRTISFGLYAVELRVNLSYADQPAHLFWLVLLAYAGPLPFWRPGFVDVRSYAWAELLICGGVSAYSVLLLGVHNGMLLSASLTVGYLYHRKITVWAAAFCIVLLPMLQPLAGVLPWSGYLLMLANGSLLFGVGFAMNRMFDAYGRTRQLLAKNRQQYEQIQEQNKALLKYAEQVEQLTLIEERSRMARELNDTIGHTFTSVAVGLDAVILLTEQHPEQAKEKLDVLRGMTRRGLDEVRRNIHRMAPDRENLPLSVYLAEIVDEFSLHTATQVQVVTEGEETPLPAQAKLTLIRCLQESLTQAKRVGGATRITVRIVFAEDRVQLRVQNNGDAEERPSASLGFRAVRERMRALNGTLEEEAGAVTWTIPRGT